MLIEYQSIFKEMLRHVPELGVERTFVHLGAEPGPANPDWAHGATLYEIYVRAFSEQGTFNAVTERLPELKDLGIEAVWLMPIYPIGKAQRKGTLGSPYAIRDYFNVNPEYGTKQDFKRLVQQAHALGMRVLIDMVPNHVAPDFVALQDQPDLILRDANGRPRRKVADWSDIADLDYGRSPTRDFMAKVMKFWIEEFDVDGYRCDVAGLVPSDFWEWVIPQLRELKPDFYLLAEWESPQLHRVGFNSTYDWSTLRLLRRTFAGEAQADLLANWILTKSAIYPQNSLPLRFLENHDLPRARQQFPGERLFAAMTLMFSLHGIPLLYNGQEIGAQTQPSLFEKEPVDWAQRDERIYQTVKELVGLRKREKALQSRQYLFYEKALERGVLAFDKANQIRVWINLSDREQPLEQNERSDVQTIVFDSQNFKQSGEMPQALAPYQAMIAKLKRDEAK